MSTTQLEPPQLAEAKSDMPLVVFLDRWQWIGVALCCLLALWIRVAPRFDLVFQPGFVNFQETDAWYHVRVAENLIHHFPWRIAVDPYVAFGLVRDTATAPFYDWVLGLVAWVAGAGAPSESLLHVIAAWYPVALAIFTVVAVFVLAKLVFGLRAGLIACAVIATLPGHFLRISSLGFTDHHIMESLLAALFFFLLLRAIQQPRSVPRALSAGLTLVAYLLTFHGAAFLVSVVVVWAIFEQLRSLWLRDKCTPSLRPLFIVFLTALAICLGFLRIAWMNYTIVALALGTLAVGALQLWAIGSRRFPRDVLHSFGSLLMAGSAGVVFTTWQMPGLHDAAKYVLERLIPAGFGATFGVYELQSLVYSHGQFTLVPALLEFYGAYVLALIGLPLLAFSLLRRPQPGLTLVLVWGVITFVLAMSQLRMACYFAIAVALLSGYVVDGILSSFRKPAWVICLCFLLLVIAPNVYAAINSDRSTGIPAEWKETLDWMRTSTPEPFGDPGFYYARYSPQQFGPAFHYPPSAYSVMAWWDYGHWIVDVARRVPVTNPTLINATAAADFFLSQSETEAISLLQTWRTRYVVVDERLPLWPLDGAKVAGDYLAFFQNTHTHRPDDYLLIAYDSTAADKSVPKIFYRPAYYRSMAVRLFLFGGKAIAGRDGATVIFTRQKPGAREGDYPQIVRTQHFDSQQEALNAEIACRKDGCALVSDDPTKSCVPIYALERFQPVYSSTSFTLGLGKNGRKAVQVYELTENPK